MDRNKAYRHSHALLGELGIRDRKADILSGYGVESAADLTDDQLTQLIGALENEKHHRRAEREAPRPPPTPCAAIAAGYCVSSRTWACITSSRASRAGPAGIG